MEDTRKNSKANFYVNQNSLSVIYALPIEQYVKKIHKNNEYYLKRAFSSVLAGVV